ncbi:ATP synthase F1 subunit epsilon [Candidatus Saccharibacteria bacterium]|nr:MAG: ATP synthase F1 subunit epsilon [Candidatus Saccharibacteria bacterium]
MKLRLVTLSGTKLNEDVYEVMLPTADGEIAVFPDHEPLVAVAVPGVISVRRKQTDSDDLLEVYAVTGGVIEIDGAVVNVLVDDADHSSEITEAEAKEALERAMKLQASASSQIELEKAHQLVDRHAVRLKVAGLRRHKRHKNI